jgi:hypothetical protein
MHRVCPRLETVNVLANIALEAKATFGMVASMGSMVLVFVGRSNLYECIRHTPHRSCAVARIAGRLNMRVFGPKRKCKAALLQIPEVSMVLPPTQGDAKCHGPVIIAYIDYNTNPRIQCDTAVLADEDNTRYFPGTPCRIVNAFLITVVKMSK